MRHFKEEIVNSYKYVVESGDIRLDVFLFERLDRSRSFCSDMISSGNVVVGGKVLKSSYKVKVGDIVEVNIPVERELDISPKKIDFEVVAETENYAIINKPAGLTVHPAPGNFDNTLVNGLMYKFNIVDEDGGFRPGIVHRLDKDTSGLLLIAKHQKAREVYSGLFKDRLVDKFYYAICSGNPKWDHKIIETYINRHKIHRKKMCSSESGKYAKSEIRVLWRGEKVFLAKIKIFTGRTHQIRVHMSDLGFPLIGDNIYGSKISLKFNFGRQALHSFYIKFYDPFNAEDVEFKVGMPEDMDEFLTKMGCVMDFEI